MLGSAHMLSDQYLEKEENGKLRDVVFQFLTAKDFKLNQIDADDPEVLLLMLLLLLILLFILLILLLILSIP